MKGAVSIVAGTGQFPQLLKGSRGGAGEKGQLRDQICEFLRATAVAGQVQVNWAGCLSMQSGRCVPAGLQRDACGERRWLSCR